MLDAAKPSPTGTCCSPLEVHVQLKILRCSKIPAPLFFEIRFKKKPSNQLKPSAIIGFGYPGEGWEDAAIGRTGGNPWHMLLAGLSMGFPTSSLMQSEKSGSETATHSSLLVKHDSHCLSCLSCHPVLLGAGTGAG